MENSVYRRPYQVRCQDCGFFFSNTRKSFQKHIQSERHCKWTRQVATRTLFCHACGKSFSRRIDILRHIYDDQCGKTAQQPKQITTVKQGNVDMSEGQVQQTRPGFQTASTAVDIGNELPLQCETDVVLPAAHERYTSSQVSRDTSKEIGAHHWRAPRTDGDSPRAQTTAAHGCYQNDFYVERLPEGITDTGLDTDHNLAVVELRDRWSYCDCEFQHGEFGLPNQPVFATKKQTKPPYPASRDIINAMLRSGDWESMNTATNAESEHLYVESNGLGTGTSEDNAVRFAHISSVNRSDSSTLQFGANNHLSPFTCKGESLGHDKAPSKVGDIGKDVVNQELESTGGPIDVVSRLFVMSGWTFTSHGEGGIRAVTSPLPNVPGRKICDLAKRIAKLSLRKLRLLDEEPMEFRLPWEQLQLNKALREAVKAGNFREAKSLLQAGADANLSREDCKADWSEVVRSPLFHAVDSDRADLVGLLCRYGANLYEELLSGESLVEYATSRGKAVTHSQWWTP